MFMEPFSVRGLQPREPLQAPATEDPAVVRPQPAPVGKQRWERTTTGLWELSWLCQTTHNTDLLGVPWDLQGPADF